MQTMAVKQQARQGRSRFVQFSLKSLLLLMLVSAVGVGWLGYRLRIARRQAAIVQGFLDAGTRVSYAHQYLGASSPPGPAWARSWFGEDFFNKVHALYATKYVTAKQLSDIQYLTDLNRVHLNNTQANDQTLEYLAKSPHLVNLYAGGSEITDVGVGTLTELTELQALVIWDNNITDAAMVSVCMLPSLTSLYVQDTHITDAGIKQLADSDAKHQLVELDVSSTGVSASCIEHIAKLEALERLLVRDIPLEIEILDQLVGLPRLKHIDVTGTGQTKSSIARLQELLPDCFIHCADVK